MLDYELPKFRQEDPARIQKISENKRAIAIKASELSGQKIECGPIQKGKWFWLYRVNDEKDYGEFWTKFKELEGKL